MRRTGKTSSSFFSPFSAPWCASASSEWKVPGFDSWALLFCLQEFRIMMVLYSGTTCPFSHRCRFVLFEKGMDFEIRDVDLYNKPEDINVMNPYGQVPICLL